MHVCQQSGISAFFFFLIFIYLAAFYLLNGLSLQHVGCSSLTRDQTQVPFMGVWHLTHWTTREVPVSLLFNTLSGFVIASLLRSKCLLISLLQSTSTVILEPRKIKSASFHFFPIYLPGSDGKGALILVFLMLSFKLAFAFSRKFLLY